LIRLGLVDDHPVFRLGLIRLFERESDLRTVWELGSLDGIDQMLDSKPVDVVLMDLILGPEQDALAATRRIREKYESVRVIIISGSLDYQWASAARAAGAHGYLPKDLPVEDMLAAIRGLAAESLARIGFKDMLSSGFRRPNGHITLSHDLTRREQQVLAELRRGRSNKEIAARLGVSVTTINKHVQKVLRKLDVRTRAQAVLAADTQAYGRPYQVGDPRR
jgi:DNA-binding NarL/FixJ family response regulator